MGNRFHVTVCIVSLKSSSFGYVRQTDWAEITGISKLKTKINKSAVACKNWESDRFQIQAVTKSEELHYANHKATEPQLRLCH